MPLDLVNHFILANAGHESLDGKGGFMRKEERKKGKGIRGLACANPLLLVGKQLSE